MVTCTTTPGERIMMDTEQVPPTEQPEPPTEWLPPVRQKTLSFIQGSHWRDTVRWRQLLYALAVTVANDDPDRFPDLSAYEWLLESTDDEMDTLTYVAALTAVNLGHRPLWAISVLRKAASYNMAMIVARRMSTSDVTEWEQLQMSDAIQSFDIHDKLIALAFAGDMLREAGFTSDELLGARE